MTNGKKVAIVVIILAVVGAGVYVAMSGKDDSNDKSNSSQTSGSSTDTSSNDTSNSSSSSDGASDTAEAAATITYSDSGFGSGTVTVKAGDTVAVKNTSSSELSFNSDPHPAHTDDPDLNVGVIASGATKTFTVQQTGTYGFHNHFNPSDKGKITVE
jgi:plastocyanin